jgi:hypothetical protein
MWTAGLPFTAADPSELAELCRVVRLQFNLQNQFGSESASANVLDLAHEVFGMASLMQREWPRSMNGALRIVIIVVAGFSIWQFSDGFLLAWETLAEPTEARWFNVLSALGQGVLGPVLALSAIALSVTNQRLLLAILAILAAAIYVAPLAAFFIGIMIYGF